MTAGPLSGSDVGPAWLTRRTIDLGKYGVPVLIMEAEKYTTLKDPNGNGLTWDVVEDPLTSGGAFLKAPAGTRTDVPAQTQDALAEYDIAFHDPGTYFLYVLSRGPNTGANSLYSPVNLGDDPTVNETVPGDNKWSWTELGSYTILAADVNRPLTLGIGRREGGVEIDKFLLSPVQLTLSVPEPSLSLSALVGGVTLLGRRRRPGRRRVQSCRSRLD